MEDRQRYVFLLSPEKAFKEGCFKAVLHDESFFEYTHMVPMERYTSSLLGRLVTTATKADIKDFLKIPAGEFKGLEKEESTTPTAKPTTIVPTVDLDIPISEIRKKTGITPTVSEGSKPKF